MNEKYVLFLDILGFKDLVEKNTPEELDKIYRNQVIEAYGPAVAVSNEFSGRDISIQFNSVDSVLKDTVQDTFNFHVMSDSIIVWTNDIDNNSLKKLLAFTSVYISMTLTMGVPLRGAISKGYISEINAPMNNITQSCFVGTGIVNAYQLEGTQDWMGCIVDEECVKDIPSNLLEQIKTNKDSFIVSYNVPIKCKEGIELKKTYVVNWVASPLNTIENSIEYFQNKFSQFKKDITDDRVKRKIEHTYKFYKDVLGYPSL